MRSHTMTPARRAALKKAQLASARKRKGHGRKNWSDSVRSPSGGKPSLADIRRAGNAQYAASHKTTRRKSKRPKNKVNAGLHAAAVVATYVGARNLAGNGTYLATKNIWAARAIGTGVGVGAGVVVNRKIANINAKRKLARKTVSHGHKAQKGRRISR
jgi:hypothetical protein